MKTLSIVLLTSLVMSFITDLIFNLIIMPVKKDREKSEEGPHYIGPDDLVHYIMPINRGC